MILLDLRLLKKFLKRAGDELEGEWLLVGGTVLPILGIDHRVTTDIDLLPLGNRVQNKVILDLMKLAESLGLPIETINQASLYFLEKIPNYSEKLVLLYKGKAATIYRPNVNLFIEMKIKRLTESDFSDCVQFLKFARKVKEPVDKEHLKLILTREQKASKNTAHGARLQKLYETLFGKD